MKLKNYILCALAGVMLFACNTKSGTSDSSNNETISNQENEVSDTLVLRTFANHLYDDILQKYDAGESGMDYAFKNYASKGLLKVLDDADKVGSKSGVAILGWDCDPWVYAQDWAHPKATILKTHTLTDAQGYVDVLLQDEADWGNDRKIRLLLIKEDGEWKVNDFVGAESEGDAPTFTEVLLEEMASATK